MRDDKFNRIKKAFERNDGLIDQSEEAQRLLKYHNAEAATLNAKTIILKPNPTNAEVFEELIHTAQYRTGRADGSNIVEMEIEAAKKLLRFADKYKLKKSDIIEIEKRLQSLLRIE